MSQHKQPGRGWVRPTKPTAAEQARIPHLADRPVKSDQPVRLDTERGERRLKPSAKLPAHNPVPTGNEPVEYPDQQPPAAAAPHRHVAAEIAGDQYVRLRIQVREDQLSVLDSHLVDGPLAQTTAFPGRNAYEVTLDDRLLHAGALPDLGIQRSFQNPEGPAEQRGHHLVELGTYEFMARVPARELTAETIGRIRVTLHRVTEEVRARRLSAEPLARQFERQIRPVAELVGLPDTALPEAIAARGGRTPSV